MRGRELIGPGHLERMALVYVRQSTPGQVLSNTESTRSQYGLREQALALGWSAQRIEIVDEDLGVSASGLVERPGFAQLTLAVARGQVGAVFGLDVTRLSRNTPEWFELLRWLEHTDTLLVEGGQVFDLASADDSFLLAIKGTVSARERYAIVKRLSDAQRAKAARGELRVSVPAGYVWDGERMRKDPNEQVRNAIGEVFAKFEEQGSARQTAQALRQAGTRLPARQGAERGEVRWREATYERVYHVLTNPAMGGAYAWGRTRTEVRLDDQGRPRKRVRKQPRERWRVLLEERHEGYVSWREWLEIQERLAGNNVRQGAGAPREGRALLQGLARCGRCGCRMHVNYGKAVQYRCLPSVEVGSKLCQSVGASRVDELVAEALLETVGPGCVEAALQAERRAEEGEERQLRSYRLEVKQREYEYQRAEREYRQVEPEYRLVKRTLAADWERAHERLEGARAELERAQRRLPRRVSAADLEAFAGLGKRLRRLWEHAGVGMRERKRLLGALLDEAVLRVRRDEGQVQVVLHWRGGWVDELEAQWTARRPVEPPRDDVMAVNMVRRLARYHRDDRIARTLERQGLRTAQGLPFTARRVRDLRYRHGVAACDRQRAEGEAPMLSVPEAARELGVSASSVYRWLGQGFAIGERAGSGDRWRVLVDEELRSLVCPSAPEGFLPQAEALRALSVSRETLRQRIRSGGIAARWIARGPRKGLYVRVERPGAPLFEGVESAGDEEGTSPSAGKRAGRAGGGE